MPIMSCQINGQSGYKYGKSGKCYIGKNAKQMAVKQAIAIGGGKMPKDSIYYEDDLIFEDNEDQLIIDFIPPPYPKGMAEKYVKILKAAYSNVRSQWVKENPKDPENKVNKQKAAQIAWAAVEKAGYKKPKDEDDLNNDNIKLHLDTFDETKLLLTSNVTRTSEGYLKGRAIVTNTGIFNYLVDGKILKELREDDEVFKSESLESLKNKPITDGHPKEMVNTENVKKYQVGFTGSDVQNSGHAVSIDYTITDKEMIGKIESGEKRAISCGYRANLDYSVQGKYFFGNNPVDCKQKDIIYNHVAIVEQGRAGDLAKIPMNIDNMNNNKVHTQIINNPMKEDRMDGKNLNTTYKIDGVDYEVEKDVAKHLHTLNTSLEKKDKDISDLQTKVTQAEAKRDALQTEVDKLTKEKNDNQLTDKQIQDRVNQRLELIQIADSVNVKIDDNMSDKDIKLAIIKSKNDNVDFSDKDETYIDAYFDSVKNILLDEIKNTDQNKKKVFGKYLNNNNDSNQNNTSNSKQKMYDDYKEKIIRESNEYKGSISVQ